ncbi:VOC family protein [Gulosibacter bifidus]|uniref:VOC family protein n=1 Tax=Gulosibacter bifidus TaxID=272239 RepID=A0ABW5RKB5_9MICO|nr:VOC family protein [Gulosibacter bifidus]
MPPRLASITIDCADADATGTFFGAFLELDEAYASDDRRTVCLQADGYVLSFITVDGYEPPHWPQPGQQLHLDLEVDDLEAATAHATQLGASLAEPQPQPDAWRVMLDPSGHPFCLMLPFGS